MGAIEKMLIEAPKSNKKRYVLHTIRCGFELLDHMGSIEKKLQLFSIQILR